MHRIVALLTILVASLTVAGCSTQAAAESAGAILTYPTSALPTPTPGQHPAAAAPALSSASTPALSPTDLLARWQVVDTPSTLPGEGGRWVVNDGYLAQDGLQPAGTLSAGEAALIAPEALSDGTIRLAFYDAANGTVGLIARSSAEGHYRLRLFANPSWDGMALALDRVGPSNSIVSLAVVNADPLYTSNDWHSLSLTTRGNQLRVALDGRVVAVATDPNPLPAGRPGILARALGGIAFDQVTISGGN